MGPPSSCSACWSRWTTQVCTVASGQIASIASGSPLSPAQQTISSSPSPRFFSSVSTDSQKLWHYTWRQYADAGPSGIRTFRYPHTEGRAFYEQKPAEGKTRKEAIRSLKRRISDVAYRHLVADQTSYRDAHYSDLTVLVSGDHGFATWTFTGIPSTGHPLPYRGVDILEFAGSLIRRKDAFRKERSDPLAARSRSP